VQDIIITPGYVLSGLGKKAPGYDDSKVPECLTEARRTQLKSFVAPPALLFVTKPDTGREPGPFTLSRGNTIRIAGVTGLVLLVTILITVVVGLRLVRPLRDLTEAAQQSADLRNKIPIASHDEIGYLAQALNDQSERRAQLEQQRNAMVNDVAHELRTPLTNIRTSLEAAQDGVTPVDSQLIELLHEEALLLQHIIEDLRDLAAADAGQLRVHPERVYANDLLAQVVEAHRGAAETAGVQLSATTVADPEVVVDPVRLRQLVGNLVGNALRHTPRGGRVTITSRLDADHHLLIDVADTGVGIAPDDLPKVFDRFWRADASRARSTGGSGLGLAIARKLAEAHAGGIGVTSSLGSGTVFTVSVPASTGPGHS
jgi:two-component system sensor histidine kinase BaeS